MEGDEKVAARSPGLDQVRLAKRFHDLHRAPDLLVLPNAWDAGSAVMFERAGFPAVGTTSAGIAYSLGYPDGQRLSFDELLAAQAAIARRLTVPLTVDVEAGYGSSPEEVAANVELVIAAGAVGVNVEDGRDGALADVALQVEVIAAVGELKARTGVPFVINARTDSYWLGLGDEASQLEESVRRGNAYLEAGADCVFVPGGFGSDVIATLVAEIDGPLNVIASPACPSPRELQELGVARLSTGSAPVRAALGLVRDIARALRGGDLAWVRDVTLSYGEANALFE